MSRKILALGAAGLALAASLALTTLAAAGGGDRNSDRIPDRWERRHHLSLKVNQAKRDQDHDGLNNMGEYRAKLDPRDDDSDDDGVEDGDENAGAITSFADGVLTITLAGGGTLSATVTDRTEIECEEEDSTNTSMRGDDDDDDGDHEDGDQEDGDNEDGDNDESCGAEALTAGRPVEEAELKTRGGKAVWEEIELGS